MQSSDRAALICLGNVLFLLPSHPSSLAWKLHRRYFCLVPLIAYEKLSHTLHWMIDTLCANLLQVFKLSTSFRLHLLTLQLLHLGGLL